MAMRLPTRRSSRTDAALDARERRLDGAQQKRAGKAHPLQRLADDARLQRADIRGDVGQFRHRVSAYPEEIRLNRRLFRLAEVVQADPHKAELLLRAQIYLL